MKEMLKNLTGVLVLAALPALAAEPVLVDYVAAYVNDHVITLGDVQVIVGPRQQELQARHKGGVPDEQLTKLYDEGLGVLVDRYLILDSFKEQDGKIPPWAIDQEVESIIRENFNGDRAALMTALSKDHQTFETWRDEIQNHIIVSSLRSATVGQNVRILPRQTEAYYEENLAKYTRVAQARLSVIVLKKDGPGKDDDAVKRRVEAVRQRLAKGEEFAAVAKDVSQGPKAAEGGDWGWVAVEDLRAELKKALAGLKDGDISEAVNTPDEVYIVKLEEKKEAGTALFQDVRAQIEQELRKRETERLYKAWVESLKRKAYVKIVPWKGLES
jgi:peptidyl-prolyl cis-trans isomerase SurA